MEAVHSTQDRLHAGQQGPTGVTEHRAVGAAIEQLDTGLGFQPLDGIGHGRLGSTQGAGRRREAAGLDHGEEHAQLLDGRI